MRNIQPFNVWVNGTMQTATKIVATAQDNLQNYATFAWVLASDENSQIASGNLTMTMPEYQNFTDNDFAYNWICEQLGLTLLPETNTQENGTTETSQPSA